MAVVVLFAWAPSWRELQAANVHAHVAGSRVLIPKHEITGLDASSVQSWVGLHPAKHAVIFHENGIRDSWL